MSDSKTGLPDSLLSRDIERSVAGDLWESGDHAAEWATLLRAEDFRDGCCARAVKAIQTLVAQGKPVNPVAVMDAMGQWNEDDWNYLHTLPGIGFGHLATSVEQFKKLVSRRRLWTLAQETAEAVETNRLSPDQAGADMVTALSGISDASGWQSGTNALRDTADEIGSPRYPVATPWPTVNRWTYGGIQKGNIWGLAGVTSHGKTATAMAITHLALSSGKRVAYVAFENKADVVKRLCAVVSGIELGAFYRVGEEARSAVDAALASAPVFENLTLGGCQSSGEIVAFAHRSKPDLLVIDYAQVMAAYEERNGKDQRISWLIVKMMAAIKGLCERTGLRVLMLGQLDQKAVMSRDDKRPRNSDVQESQSIVQAADVMILVNRPGRSSENGDEGKFQIGVSKNKNGVCGWVACQMDTSNLRITEEERGDGKSGRAAVPAAGTSDRASGEAAQERDADLWAGA